MNATLESVDAVVVGASVAGAATVRALRRRGFDGSIVLVNDRPSPECDRPPLSKQFLAGEWDRQRVTLLADHEAAGLGVRVLHGVAAVGLDAAARTLALADGRVLRYGTAVIATGATARRPPWARTEGVYSLRTADDAEQLRARLVSGANVVVVGGGYIGSEVAATARRLGCAVTIVDPLVAPLAPVLGSELADHLVALHERHGVQAVFGRPVVDVRRESEALRVQLAGGSSLGADLVVVGIGAVPNTAWLTGSDIGVDDGVLCDNRLRVGGRHDLHAVGDVARWTHPRFGSLRIEHWTNAVDHAAAAADDIVAPHDSGPAGHTPYVWSDQYDTRLQIAGLPTRAVTRVVVGDLIDDAPAAVVYGAADGTACAVATVNWPRAALAGRRAVAAALQFDEVVVTIAALLPATVSPH